MCIRLCSIECCFAHPLDVCPTNRTFVDDIRNWNKICNRLYIWDYVINYAHSVQPFPNLYALAPNIRFFIKHGVKEVCACAVHGVLCGDAITNLQESIIKEVVVTNTVRIGKEKMFPKLTILSVADLFAKAIERIHKGQSVSTLFSNHLEFAK